ncbi:sensor histidine kinase [Desulfosporosinus metallidurans]|uniref:histidine kinase n=1 Tax=Desulfosporosinus metallidurans TaxID=1888891 RepID=A0A1Q8QXP8_9FIRM|nr:ATP-binding protein [Desulfosporosinus metallidurans]OLN32106.1 Osmosensitive K+ channel histidine kinase KdpD [Desulfosporosinus metallidurans]
MTLRRKFILALIGMVFFMAIVFTSIALTSTQALLSHAESYVQQAFGERLSQLVSVYYENHGGWGGVQDYISKVLEPDQKLGRPPHDSQRFLVFDQEDKVVADPSNKDLGKQLTQFPSDNKISKQWQGIKVKGQIVGHYWQEQRPSVMDGRLAKTIGTSIIQAMLIGLILTSLVALVLGLLLTSHFTEPLNRLMEAVRKVGKGDLSSRVEVEGKGDIALLAQDFNRMTEQLTRNEEVRRNMVADIAHELRTPLAVILGKLESIQEGVLPSTPETILPIQDETLRLIRLVRDLQQLSLAEAGKLPMNLKPVNLRQIVEKITEQFAIEFEERGLHIEVIGDVPEVIGDPDRLTQVFVNLIGNALLHTPAGGSLSVLLAEAERPLEDALIDDETRRRLRDVFRRKGEKAEEANRNRRDDNGPSEVRSDGWVQVTVVDSGEGIPEEELDHIFDRFYRVDKARERESGGTGLGLAIAKEFIQAHGGSIQVKSKPGVGSCFWISLPIKPNASTKGNTLTIS